MISITPRIRPILDTSFLPAALWNKRFHELVGESADLGKIEILEMALERRDRTVFRKSFKLLASGGHPDPDSPNAQTALNLRYVERQIKFLLWSHGGDRIHFCGNPKLTEQIRQIFSKAGARSFDWHTLGLQVFGDGLNIIDSTIATLPDEHCPAAALGRNLEGCRIGFDLGGSDRKCAALIDGEVVFSEEVPWDPYFQNDPQYHYDGLLHSLKRAAAHLPRVDAIGGSAAGVYIDNEVRVASLFRGIDDPAVFDSQVRPIFKLIAEKEYPDTPFHVINDGEVTALAGAIALKTNAVLGISMGTSQAVGYVDPYGPMALN